MRTIQFNSIGGASGDMILGALIGLGLDLDALNTQLQSLLPEETYRITLEKTEQHHLSGVRASVEIRSEPHHHRHLADIRAIIDGSTLPDPVKAETMRVFTRLAEAEANVHGTTPEHIHFHEVGAIDSIVDITGCCLARHLLGIDRIAVGPLPLGCVTVQCAHGILPIPVPATVELLRGMEVCQTDEPFELVTPTGAALLRCWHSADPVRGTVVASSYSFGHRTLNGRPNLLRATLLESCGTATDNGETDRCTVLECNLDDCTAEIVGGLFNRLLAGGALEVFTQPVLMKKQRQGILLTVIAATEQADALKELIFSESTTFGIRAYTVERSKLSRTFITAETPYGKIRLKVGYRGKKPYSLSPEYEDCAAAAAEHHVPVKDAYAAALAAGRTTEMPFL